MKKMFGFVVGVVALSAVAVPEWPKPTAETKPWTINWWPASAVDEKGLAAQMDALAEAGFGGMRVIPIYEVKGYETNGVEMLTDEWYRRYKMGYDLAKARGLEMDLSMGAGWCFGGKWIPERLGVHALVGVTNGQPVVEFKQIGVKRTSKADWGWMLNPFSMEAMELHLKQFERFGKDGIPCPRAFCHDSFEYFFASWSDDMKTVPDTPEKLPLYRRELSDREVAVFSRWAAWCRQRGIRTCNQAHGSPGDLLSLYALADIPETEMFGDAPNEYVSKFASSAAHLKGTQTVGAETFTWLDEHFRETPEKMKHAFDLLVLSGINQVYLEGTCYSAAEAEWPGWLFYAASQMNPRNPLWNHLKAFWTYVERNQNLSQTSVDDADLLVYHPFENWWRKPLEGKNPKYAQQMTVHDTSWLTTYPLLRHLAFNGIAFDYVSEGTLHFLEDRPHHYKAILIPPEHYVSPAAEEKIAELARKQGLKILRPASLQNQLNAEDLKAIDEAGIRREPFCGPGKNGRYVRFRRGKDTLYFVLNPFKKPIQGPFRLSVPVKAAWILDAMDGSITPLEVAADGTAVCDIPPNAARWIWTSPDEASVAAPAAAPDAEMSRIPVPGPWTLTPVVGGPEPLPVVRKMAALTSWSTRTDGTDEPFCGTMRYETAFDLPPEVAPESVRTLDLGDVKWTARVILNGRELATLVAPPYAVRVPAGLFKEKGNRLVVEVANLGRNRIRDMDRRGIEWRNFYIVDRGYKTFNLKDAPNEPSGLLGPVTLSCPPRDWGRSSGHFVRLLSHWNHAGHDGEKIAFSAETDCPEAKLIVNGKPFGEVRVTEHPKAVNRFTWEVPYQPGLVQVIGMKEGSGVIDCGVRTAEDPVRVRLTPDNKTGLRHRVQVAVVDRNGVENPLAATRVLLCVRGNARVEPRVVRLANGFGEAVVTRLGDGEVELVGSADGLEPMSVFFGKKPVPEKTDASFTVASYNVRAAMGCDPMPHRWFERAPRIVETIEHEGYDIVGIQEAERFWCARLAALLPGWRYVYSGREANGEGESASIFWNDARFALVDQGNFWLSETPDVPGSRSWNTSCPRTCTWGRFKDRKTGKEFLLFNTHLDCSSLAARTNGMRVLLDHLVALRKQTGLPAFFMGDLNISYAYKKMKVDDNHPLVMASKVLTAMWDKSETPHEGPFSSWLGLDFPFDREHPYSDPDGRIDHLFVSEDVRVLTSRTCDFFPQGLQTSDHRSISCDVELGCGL